MCNNLAKRNLVFSRKTKDKKERERERETEKVAADEGEIQGGRIGRLCLSPRAQLRRHHGDRCLHSPQFEQCPAVLGHTAHSFAPFHVAGLTFPSFSLLLAVSVLFLEPAIPGIPGQNERYTSEKDASLFLFTIPAATVDGKEQECAYTGIVEAEEWWTMRTAMRLSVEPRKSTQLEVPPPPPPCPPSTRTK